MDQIDPRQRVPWRPRQQLRGIAGEQADVWGSVGLDLRQDFRHAVDIGFAADEAGVGKGARFRDQMLAATKSDFEANVFNRRIKQRGKIGRAGAADVERQPRQQMFDQVGLMDAELVALAAPEKRTVGVNAGAIVRRVGIRVIVPDRGLRRSSQRLVQPMQQPRPRFDRRNIELLVMGMRALAVDAEAVERRGMRCGEIAVGAAAGRGIHQIEADLGGERPGVFVECGAGIVLFVRRAVQARR